MMEMVIITTIRYARTKWRLVRYKGDCRGATKKSDKLVHFFLLVIQLPR